MFWIYKCEGWYSFKTYSITAEIKTQELLHLSKIIASFKQYFSHLIHTIFHTFRLENFKDNMFSYKQATPMCFSGLLHCFFSWADGSQRSYWQSSHAPSLLLHHLQNSWKHVPGVIVCSTDSMSSGECSPEPSHIQQEGPDKLRHGSGAGGPGRLPRRAAWYQNICSHAQSSLALPYEEASSNETEFLRYLFIYLFVYLVYRLCRKGISWHRAGSKEFGSSPEKSVTGLGFFSSDLKEFISSSHINKPYACLGNKIITTTLHIHITICPFLFWQQFFHGLKWKGKKKWSVENKNISVKNNVCFLIRYPRPFPPPYSSMYRTIKHRNVHKIVSIKGLVSASQQKCEGQYTGCYRGYHCKVFILQLILEWTPLSPK